MKTIIPAVLFGTMLIGMFVATIPVYEASTVHTTLQTGIEQTRETCITMPNGPYSLGDRRHALTTTETKMDGFVTIFVNNTARSDTRNAAIFGDTTRLVAVFGDEGNSRGAYENATLTDVATVYFRNNLTGATTKPGSAAHTPGPMSTTTVCAITEKG